MYLMTCLVVDQYSTDIKRLLYTTVPTYKDVVNDITTKYGYYSRIEIIASSKLDTPQLELIQQFTWHVR